MQIINPSTAGASLLGFGATGDPDTVSSTAFATKGIVFKPTQNITAKWMQAYIQPNSVADTYALGISSLSAVTIAATGEVTAATVAVNLTTTGNIVITGVPYQRVNAPCPDANMDAGNYYLIWCSITSGTGVSPSSVGTLLKNAGNAWDINVPGDTFWGGLAFNTIVLSAAQSPSAFVTSKYNISFGGVSR